MVERRALISIVHNGPVVYTKTTRSLMALGWGNRVEKACALSGFASIDFQWQHTAPRVDILRNQAIRDALHMGASHLIFLDADMTFPDDLLMRLFEKVNDEAIVGGLYVLKSEPYAPVALVNEREIDGVYWFDPAPVDRFSTDMMEVDVIGMGCTMIPTAVFHDIKEPWFYYRDDQQGYPRVSEDVAFCQDARRAGWPVLLNPSLRLSHLAVDEHDPEWGFEYIKQYERLMSQGAIRISGLPK